MGGLRIGSVFPQSRELKTIIKRHGWDLYDVPRGKPFSWDELNKLKPARKFVIGNTYLFIPRPKKKQTLRDAYSATQGLGPSLRIENPADQRWVSLELPRTHHLAVFTCLVFGPRAVVAMTPESAALPNPDIVVMSCEKFIDTFAKFYGIVTPQDYEIAILIEAIALFIGIVTPQDYEIAIQAAKIVRATPRQG